MLGIFKPRQEPQKSAKWTDNITVFSTVLTIITLLNVGMVIAMLVLGVIHSNRYTYWNYIFQTAFFLTLMIGYVSKSSYLVRVVTVFLFPMAFGSAFFVFVYIIVVLQCDDGEMFVAASNLGGGRLDVGTVHTFDELLHVFPLTQLLLLLLSGYSINARAIYSALHDSPTVSLFERVAITIWPFVAPFSLISVYILIFNPTKEYPTPDCSFAPFIVGIACYFLIVWFLFAFLKTKKYGRFSKSFEKHSTF